MKLKIYKFIFVILIIICFLVLFLIGMKYKKEYENEKENERTIEIFSKEINVENTEEEKVLEMNGYPIIGIIKIPKINIEYPILDIETHNPDETEEPMKFSIVKYWGGKVNDYGNLSIAGHNNHSGTMFGKTKNLKIGDIIELTDLDKQTINYKIYDIFVTDPNDVTILKTIDSNFREVTLITCTNGNKNRLIIKAKEV